jgi:chromate reductase, NAD(P)H dehydrogenase (quinone)
MSPEGSIMDLSPPPPRTGPYRVLAISGSLRARSANAVALQAAAALAPAAVKVHLYPGLADLPHFNPDLDCDEHRPASVGEWRTTIAEADALLISTPEYAHGIPGTLKNALDWLVSGLEFPSILAAVLRTSPYATHAHAALVETLTTMSSEVLGPASVIIPIAGRHLTLDQVLSDSALVAPVRDAMAALTSAMAEARAANRRLVPPPPPAAP